MGMKPTFYVMAGAAIPRSQFPGDPWDDKWLPHVEGHPGQEMLILQGEGDDNIYCGRVLASMDTYDEAGHRKLTPKFEGVVSWLRDELNWQGDVGVMLVSIWR